MIVFYLQIYSNDTEYYVQVDFVYEVCIYSMLNKYEHIILHVAVLFVCDAYLLLNTISFCAVKLCREYITCLFLLQSQTTFFSVVKHYIIFNCSILF